MTITTSANTKQYTGNGVTTAFAFPYLVLDQSHVVCYVTTPAGVTSSLALTTGFTVAGVGLQAGITVTTTAAVANLSVLTIQRIVPATQQVDYTEGDAFPAETHEQALDKLTMLAQQNASDIGRSLRLSPATLVPGFNTVLPDPEAGKFWRTNLAGTDMEQVDAVADNGNWTGSGTGATERTVDSKLGDFVNARDFGVVADGATNCTSSLQAAIDYALANGRTLYLPYGTIMVTTLTVAATTAGLGPLKIVGESAPGALTAAGRGTRIKQIAGTTDDVFQFTGDWGVNPNRAIGGLVLKDFAIEQASACTGWAIDAINITNRQNLFENVTVYTPGTGSEGGIRLRSCWGMTIVNLEMRGPASGTSRGLVMYGDSQGAVSDGTSNMVVIINPNIQYYGDCNMQLGKWTESGGGFAHAYKVIGGQVGHATKYGLVIGRVLDVDIDTLHTEVNGYSGVMLADDAGSVDPFRIKMRIDSYNDGMSATADTADSYAVQIAQGVNVDIDLRTQEARAGIYIADNTSTSGIRIADSTHFGAKTDGTTSRSALYFARTSDADTYTAEVGKYTFGGTWGNGPTDVVSGPFQQRQYTNGVYTITDTDATIPIYPWTSAVRLAPSGAKSLTGFAMISPYVEMPQQRMRLYFNNSDTTVNDVSSGGASDFRLADGVDWTPRQYDTLDVELRDGEWCEVSRSYNSSRTQSHGNATTMAVSVWTALIRSTTSVATDVTGFTVTGALPDGFTVPVHFTTANVTLKDASTTGTWNLSGSADYNPPAGTIMEFTYSNGAWYESGRVNT